MNPLRGPEHRIESRHAIVERATAILADNAAVPCVVRDWSRSGARLVFRKAVALPDRFAMGFASGGQTMKVRLAWQNGLTAGVHFEESSPDAPAYLPPWLVRKSRS